MLGKHKGAIAYARAEFLAGESREVEFRIGCQTGHKIWLNGEFAGEFSEYGPAGWTEPFSLDVTRLLRWGAENRIAVRVMNTAAGGGIYKPVTIRVLGAAKP